MKYIVHRVRTVLRSCIFNRKTYFIIILSTILITFKNPFSHKHFRNKTKFVLYWSPYLNDSWGSYSYGYEAFKGCEYYNCYATKDRNFVPLEDFSALIFHASYDKARHGTPDKRSSEQIYIFLSLEPPPLTQWNLKPYKSYFNWTMTYRLDSDIVILPGYFSKEETGYKIPSREVLMNKSGAFWFADHCSTDSKREVVAEELQELYDVNIFGSKGKWLCPYGRKIATPTKEEFDIIETTHKFFLLFDNYYCQDYISRNLYKVLLMNIVPVVYSRGTENKFHPSKSVINIENFHNMMDLASYLMYLDNNVDQYAKYFEWKKKFVVHFHQNILIPKLAFCQLCKKLHKPIVESVYYNIYEWWWGKRNSMCKTGKSLPSIVTNLLYLE